MGNYLRKSTPKEVIISDLLDNLTYDVFKTINSLSYIKHEDIPEKYCDNDKSPMIDLSSPDHLDKIDYELKKNMDKLEEGFTLDEIRFKISNEHCYLSGKKIKHKVLLPCCCNVCDYDELIKKLRGHTIYGDLCKIFCNCGKTYQFLDLIYLFTKFRSHDDNFYNLLPSINEETLIVYVGESGRDMTFGDFNNDITPVESYVEDIEDCGCGYKDTLIVWETISAKTLILILEKLYSFSFYPIHVYILEN